MHFYTTLAVLMSKQYVFVLAEHNGRTLFQHSRMVRVAGITTFMEVCRTALKDDGLWSTIIQSSCLTQVCSSLFHPNVAHGGVADWLLFYPRCIPIIFCHDGAADY